MIVRGSREAPGSSLAKLESRIEAVNLPQTSVESIESRKGKPHVFDDWKEPGQRYIVYQPR